ILVEALGREFLLDGAGETPFVFRGALRGLDRLAVLDVGHDGTSIPVRAEPVEALPFSCAVRKDSPSTGSGRTVRVDRLASETPASAPRTAPLTMCICG